MGVRAHVHVCVCICVCVSVSVSMCVFVRACVDYGIVGAISCCKHHRLLLTLLPSWRKKWTTSILPFFASTQP